MREVPVSLDDDIYNVVKAMAARLRLSPRLFLRVLLSTVIEEVMTEKPDSRTGTETEAEEVQNEAK